MLVAMDIYLPFSVFLIHTFIYLPTLIISSTVYNVEHPQCDVHERSANCSSRNISAVPQRLPSDITVLLVAKNDLTATEPFAFQRYKHLQILDLSRNMIRVLRNNSFYGLEGLITLLLSHNVLGMKETIYLANCFVGLTQLQRLDIGNNIPIGWFIQQHTLYDYPDKAIGELISLRELILDGLPNTEFGPGFRKLVKLEKLQFSNCYINYVRKDMFLNIPHIISLRMYHCHIYDVHKDSFANLPHIDTLDLSDNPQLHFPNATNILYGLRHTKIRVLILKKIYPRFMIGVMPPSDWFKHLQNTSLKILYLDHNNIEMAPAGTLDYFPPSVERLSITDNKFTFQYYILELQKITGMKFIDVSEMDIGHDIIQPVGDDLPNKGWFLGFSPPPNLETVIARNIIMHAGIPSFTVMKNIIKFVDVSSNGFTIWKGPIFGFDKLEQLDLSKNYCSKIYSTFFPSFPSLKFLNVSNNDIGFFFRHQLSSDIFNSLTQLIVLDISSNRIKTLPSKLFVMTTMLKHLNLSNNEIFECKFEIKQLPLLTLSIEMNEIRSISGQMQEMLDNINKRNNLTLNLSDNPLMCTCENEEFIVWIEDTVITLQNWESYRCVNEKNVYVPLTVDLILAMKKNCKSYSGLAFGVGSVTIFCLSIVLVGILYRYRWKIKYLYYVARDRLRLNSHEQDGQRQFTFDAFISFANEDLEFVDTLMTKLEAQGVSLCVHHRDFRLGEPIGSNIVRAVQSSKHTVLILSDNFLTSDWCCYEFEMARMEAVYVSRNVLFVVKIDEINSANVPRELLYMMRSESYLEYPDNVQDQTTFWLNLTEALQRD